MHGQEHERVKGLHSLASLKLGRGFSFSLKFFEIKKGHPLGIPILNKIGELEDGPPLCAPRPSTGLPPLFFFFPLSLPISFFFSLFPSPASPPPPISWCESQNHPRPLLILLGMP